MSLAIEFNHISKSYGDKAVLDNISYIVERGEFVGLVGVNGAGKTTMIKSMLDLTDVGSGSITLFGVPHQQTYAREKIAYLPERFSPPAFFKGNDFLKYMLELHKIEYGEEEVKVMLKQLDFDCVNLSKYINTYSKGMVQKLGLAASFLSTKPLLVLDEPMSGLDPQARMYLKEYFLSLKQQHVTLFISTHLLVDAASICDRLIVLHNANIVFQGIPQQFLEKYHSTDYDVAFVNCISAQ